MAGGKHEEKTEQDKMLTGKLRGGPKAVFLDIDGTFTVPGSVEPPASAAEAVKRAREKGNRVFLCSGRNLGMLQPLLAYGFDGYVASAGGHVVLGEKVLYDCPMSPGQRDRLLELLHYMNVYCSVESLYDSYTDEGLKEFLAAHASEGANSELLRWRKQLEKTLHIMPMAQYRGEAVYKIIAMTERKEKLLAAQNILSDTYHVCIQDDDSYGYANGEITLNQFDKGTGVKAVCDALGLSLADAVVFGDGMNDVEMMTAAGFSVCMANGSPALKKIASAVCPPVTEDGLARAFAAYGLM